MNSSQFAVSAYANPAYVRLLRHLLESLQVDTDALLTKAGLSWAQLSKDPQGIPFKAVNQLIQAGVATTGCPWIGVELGAIAGPSSHGQVGSALLASADLRQALGIFAKFGCLRSDFFVWKFTPVKGGAELSVRERFDHGLSRDFLNDVLFGIHSNIIETVIGRPATSVIVDVPRERPSWEIEFRKRCKGQIHFGASSLTFYVPDELLDLPSVMADFGVCEVATSQCEALLATHSDIGLTRRVKNLLTAATSNYPTLIEVANQLNLSHQTLMRRLKGESTSFQEILDEVRSARALWYLQNTMLPVEEIAAALGYVDTSNFSRTVRRWFGVAPGDLRNQSREIN